MRRGLSIGLLATLIVALLLIGACLQRRQPVLTVHLDLALMEVIHLDDFKRAFEEAGVARLNVVASPPPPSPGKTGRDVRVGVVLSPDRNPQLDDEMLRLGLTGPGYTVGWVGYVYAPDIDLFLAKHRAKFEQVGVTDLAAVRRRLITNAAVHEAWHAITQSTSHNVTDMDSVMYIDPGKAAVAYGTKRLAFTRGHRARLQSLFKPEGWH